MCGHCCILHPTVILTEDEVNSGFYIVRKRKLDKDYIIKKKTLFIKELNKRKGVCYYFDYKDRKCKIHDYKPHMCKREYCGGTQYQDEWDVYLSNI